LHVNDIFFLWVGQSASRSTCMCVTYMIVLLRRKARLFAEKAAALSPKASSPNCFNICVRLILFYCLFNLFFLSS
jgi:hypothetical protein